MHELIDKISHLSPVRRKLLELALAGKKETPAATPALARGTSTGPYPLSFAQQRLWFLDQLDPNSTRYNISHAVQLKGPLNAAALKKALGALVQRHEALRTRFISKDGTPLQVITEVEAVDLPLTDLSAASETTRSAELLPRLQREEVRRPFDLSRDALLRARLVKTAADEHVMFLTVHHIATDEWSFEIMFQELAALYAAFANGRPARLPGLPVRYADFAQWQRQYLSGGRLERQLGYWMKQLQGLSTLRLPTDHPRSAEPAHNGDCHAFRLPKELTPALKALARGENATEFMFLLAAFQALLGRLSGQRDVAVGSPVANRTNVEVERVVGFFVNTLVLRADLSGDPTFRELLARVRRVALEAYAHQDVPFEKLVEELHPVRERNQNPLFQVLFTLLSPEQPPLSLPYSALTLAPLTLHDGSAKFDLTFAARETPEGYQCFIEYNTSLFEAASIALLGGHFQTLLEGLVANPDQKLSLLPLLTGGECRQLLVDWNATATEYAQESTVAELFEAQAARTPDKVALRYGRQTLNFRELNERANRLAHYLIGLSLGPEALVGLCAERSLEMVVGLLGILKAGAAYLPLDPDFPVERLRLILTDARVPVVVTQQTLLAALSPAKAKTVCLDSEWPLIARASGQNPAVRASGKNLAYVIYTSGSTGRPKGVEITQQALINLLQAMQRKPGLTSADRMLAATTLAFDIAQMEILLPLIVGGSIELVSRVVAVDGVALAKVIQDSAATVMQATPATWRLLLETGWEGRRDLKVLCGGETLTRGLADALLPRCQSLWNMYGPTETTIWSAAAQVTAGADSPVVGRPIANTQIYILDHNLKLVPAGVPGELYIGGGGLARGYLRRPGLTADKFVPDPFSLRGGQRLYKTGDLACYRPDGTLEVLGRLDHQVKLRGYRIELGEIETVLEQHPLVKQSVVTARADAAGEQRLVAYLVASEAPGSAGFQPARGTAFQAVKEHGQVARATNEHGQDARATAAPSVQEIREYLRGKLPEYMTPSLLMFLEALPLTPNGKVDRQALPTPDWSKAVKGGARVAPQLPLHHQLIKIWEELLGVKGVGITDDFFELGGHSLLAVRMMNRVAQICGRRAPLTAIFSGATIEHLAEVLLQQEQEDARAPALARGNSPGPYPLSFAQQRLWFLDQLNPNSTRYNISHAVQLKGPLNAAALKKALGALVQRHEALRTRFISKDGAPLQVITEVEAVELPLTDLSGVSATTRSAELLPRLLREEVQRPFDLSRGMLLRARLVKTAEDEHVMFLTVHHIAADEWSLEILFQELAALYAAFASGSAGFQHEGGQDGRAPSVLPDLPARYADFAQWQRSYLSGGRMEQQLSYWKKQLQGLSTLQIPTDHPRSAEPAHNGAGHIFRLSKALTPALKALAHGENTSEFILLLAAFQALLGRLSGQRDVAVGSPVANRMNVEVEKMVGFFVNTLVLRADLSGDPTFRELLARVRRVALEAYAHQDVPFEKLVEELHPARERGQNPLFQVAFTLLNPEQPPLSIPNSALTLAPLPLHDGSAKFDLTLAICETPQGYQCGIEYDTSLFEAATIARLGGCFQTLLEGLAANPDQKLSQLPLLTESEQRRLLVDWNNTKSEYPRGLGLAELFELQAAQRPEAVAAAYGGQKLTYGELNRRANQLARHLRALGVGPDVLVGLCAGRSLNMVVGALGIIKAGGAYLPLDPSYPRERLAFMLADARVSVLLTDLTPSPLPYEGRGNSPPRFGEGWGRGLRALSSA